jgi:ABC-type microcin C transport system permease subunit YejE
MLIIIISMLPTHSVVAKSNSVRVTLPDYKVSINNTIIDNTYRKYPIITYKGVTYFPMTYYDCRFIGLENTWDNKTGVKLDKTGIAGAYRDYKGTTKNKKVDTAKMATFNIKVNGKNINNSKEKYPFLTYRNVTYFPMTWNYCSQEFGITYKFDNNCLNVKSSNSKLEKKILLVVQIMRCFVVLMDLYIIVEKKDVYIKRLVIT